MLAGLPVPVLRVGETCIIRVVEEDTGAEAPGSVDNEF